MDLALKIDMRAKHLLSLIVLFTASILVPSLGDQPPAPAPPAVQEELSSAFTDRVQSTQSAQFLTFSLFTPEVDTAFIAPDGQSAVLWLALRDDSGDLLATEPGLALARRVDDAWEILLPGDPGWDELLASLPGDMLPLEQTAPPSNVSMNAVGMTALTGYYLPYAAGTARWLEGSISHFQSIPELGYPSCAEATCRYAYDFTDAWHYPLLASKTGSVFASRDSCPDSSTTCTNYIVLYNASDAAYQIYLHLAYGTIPNHLSPGTQVARGQYLGDTDDTGYSTSQHVHFMVTQNIWLGGPSAYPYYWGNSVDIRFADVTINNGIPRTCYEVTHFAIYDGANECLGDRSNPRNPANDWFVSGNTGAYPPTGALSQPVAGATVASGTNPLMDVTATASDDVRVTAVRLVARINNAWVEVGPRITTTPYDWDVDLCQIGPLNGPLEVALRVWDHEGNVSSALSPRTIQVDHACPPPSSQLLPAQVFDSTAARLTWNVTDPGVGLGSFELQWRRASTAWDPAKTRTYPASQTSAWIGGEEAGATVEFRLRAIDINGQPEPWPNGGAPDAVATLPASCVEDLAEPDDDPTQATLLLLGFSAQANLCGTEDPDWYVVDIQEPGSYLANAASQNGGAAVKLNAYTQDGAVLIASAQAPDLGQDARLTFNTPSPGRYWIKVEPIDVNLAGTGAVYALAVSDTKLTFLPLVTKPRP